MTDFCVQKIMNYYTFILRKMSAYVVCFMCGESGNNF